MPDRRVPAVEQIDMSRAPQQRADPHQRPAVGPVPLPRVLLALDAVDLLEAEEPPIDGEAGLLADVADPQRGLVGERAHRVEVEVDFEVHAECSSSLLTVSVVVGVRRGGHVNRLVVEVGRFDAVGASQLEDLGGPGDARQVGAVADLSAVALELGEKLFGPRRFRPATGTVPRSRRRIGPASGRSCPSSRTRRRRPWPR